MTTVRTSTAMSTPCRFDDKDYINWLKCSLALIHFKEGLHDYIDTEVNNLHADIHRAISTISVGTSVQNQCYSCTWRDIKQEKGSWTIKCQNKICDRWLSEILTNHTNPQNQNINWKNADITRWPTDAYEVAKVYMPKGQDQTKNLPQDFDAPAILSLLKYCVWFSQKIPNTNILSDLIEIRNEVMYSSDLRVTDFRKDICIDKMVQLLCHLNIHGTVLIELQKAKREEIKINFRETEVRVLCSVVSSIKGSMDYLCDDQHQFSDDLDTVQTTLSSIQVAQTQQRQDIQEETDSQGIKSEVEQLTEIYQKIKSFLANNPDIDDKNILENLQAIEGREMKEIKRKCAEIEDKEEEKHQTGLEAHVSNQSTIKVKVSVMTNNGSSSHNAETKIKDDFGKGSSVFSSDLCSIVVDVERGSVIICLRPLSKHAQETLAFFCQHGGMKDYILNLLKKKDLFASLPMGEVHIEVEVSCHEEDIVSEDQVDDTLVQVVGEVSQMHANETVLWSCRLDLLIGSHADEELPSLESSLEVIESTSDTDIVKQDITTVKAEGKTMKRDRNVSGDLEVEGEPPHLESCVEVIESKSDTDVAAESITSQKPVVKKLKKEGDVFGDLGEEGELM